MKKILLTSILISFLGLGFSFAQEHQFGIQSGIGIAGLHQIEDRYNYSSSSTIKPIVSYSFNLIYTFKLNKNFGLSLEPGYVSTGIKFESNFYELSDDYNWPTTRNHLIYSPLLFNWYISDKLYLNIGPGFEYHISSVSNYYGEKTVYKDLDEPFNFSAILGLNYQIINNLDVGIRYSNEIPPTNKKYYSLSYYGHFIVKYKITLAKKKSKVE